MTCTAPLHKSPTVFPSHNFCRKLNLGRKVSLRKYFSWATFSWKKMTQRIESFRYVKPSAILTSLMSKCVLLLTTDGNRSDVLLELTFPQLLKALISARRSIFSTSTSRVDAAGHVRVATSSTWTPNFPHHNSLTAWLGAQPRLIPHFTADIDRRRLESPAVHETMLVMSAWGRENTMNENLGGNPAVSMCYYITLLLIYAPHSRRAHNLAYSLDIVVGSVCR